MTDFHAIASQLQAPAKRMAGYRDLPIGKHDERALVDPSTTNAFTGFVDRERELMALLQRSVDEGEKMAQRTVG